MHGVGPSAACRFQGRVCVGLSRITNVELVLSTRIIVSLLVLHFFKIFGWIGALTIIGEEAKEYLNYNMFSGALQEHGARPW